MQEASAKGKSAQFKDRSDAVAPDRSWIWPEGKCNGTAKAPSRGKSRKVKGQGLGTSEGAAAKDWKVQARRTDAKSAGAKAGCRRERR
jgi:hypothetical protein